jgi:hypothetical protein
VNARCRMMHGICRITQRRCRMMQKCRVMHE